MRYKFLEEMEVKALGQKDIGEKVLESFNDVFADIVNVLLFDGETDSNRK